MPNDVLQVKVLSPDEVLASIRKIKEELAKVYNLGAAVSELDFGKKNLSELNKIISRINSNFEKLNKTYADFQSRLKASGQEGLKPWDIDYEKMYPGQGSRIKRTVLGGGGTAGVIAGGAVASRVGGAAKGAAGAAEGTALSDIGIMAAAGKLMGGLRAGPLGVFTGGLTIAIAAKNAVTAAVKQQIALNDSTDLLIRTTRGSRLAESFSDIQKKASDLGTSIGLTNDKFMQAAVTFARAANLTDRSAVLSGTEFATKFGFGVGLTPEESVKEIGQAQFLGITGSQGRMNNREFAQMMGESIAKGGMFANADKVFENLNTYVEKLSIYTGRTPDKANIEAFSNLRSTMYQNPALRGPGGEHLLDQLQQSIVSPGGGIAGEFFIQRALGPATGFNYATMQRLRERGPFASGPTGVTNLQSIFGRADTEFGGLGKDWKDLFLSRITGLTMDQIDSVRESMANISKGGGVDNFTNIVRKAGITPEEISYQNFGAISDIAFMSKEGLKSKAQEYLTSGNLSDKSKEDLQNAITQGGEPLRNELLRLANQQNDPANPARELNTSVADLKNELQKGIGKQLVEGLVTLTKGAARLTSAIEGIDTTLKKFFPEETTNPNSDVPKDLPSPMKGAWQLGEETRKAFKSVLGVRTPTLNGSLKDPATLNKLSNVDNKLGLSPGFTAGLIMAESSGNANAQNPNSSAKGYYQFIDSTAKAYGLINNGVDYRTDLGRSTDAYEKAMQDNMDFLRTHIENWDDLTQYQKEDLALLTWHDGQQGILNRISGNKGAKRATYRGINSLILDRDMRRYLDTQRSFRNRGDALPPYNRDPIDLEHPERYGALPPVELSGSVKDQVNSSINDANLTVTIKQQDSRGRPVGRDVNHNMNLRSPKPFGNVSVDGINR